MVLFAIALYAVYRLPAKQVNRTQLPDVVDFNWHVRPILSDRCFKCHGPDEKKREAGLRFDTQEGAFAALGDAHDHHAIVPGHPEQSTLIQRIYSTNPDSLMPTPESHLSLSDRDREILRRWIAQGAQWKKHWAFIPPELPVEPEVKDKSWPKNAIDFFVLQKLENEGLTPAPEAEKERLMRRVSFDLTGLPPTAAIRDQYLNDKSPKAYETLVDSLLASPAFGERWAMQWLDLARYSDTHGYQDDLPRTMWPWRDWVINAINRNLPYNIFVTAQLAGDQLPTVTKETLLASAFNRNHKISQEGGVIDEEYRVEYVADRTNTFGKAFMGLTYECARCHDHKYDPIAMKEYYGCFAFFNKVPERGFVPNLQTPKPYMPITQADLQGVLSFLNARSVLKTEKDTMLQMVMQDSTLKGGRKTFLLNRGRYDQPTVEVQPNTPHEILPFDTTLYARNRYGLAQWLFDKKNPLTARVAVNQLWQEIFGRGIVATPDNFGVQGALPTHPELLDWLAVQYRESGWDRKHLLRLMVCSATYRQSSVCALELYERDPENQLLARGPRYRMPYEFIRDNALAASGLLVKEIGGPSVKPWQPGGLWEEISTEKTSNNFRGEYTYIADTLPEKIYRRSLYTYNKRTIPPPSHLAFDAPARDNCEVKRARTSTPLQALNLLNDKQMLEVARVMAQQLIKPKPDLDANNLIAAAFYELAGRSPGRKELNLLDEQYQNAYKRYKKTPDAALKMLAVGRAPQTQNADPAQTAALMLTICTVLNLDEVMTKS